MAEVTELITKFVFEGSESPLNNYNASLGKSIGLLAGFTAGAFAASAAIAKWTTSVLAAEQPLINLSAETGVAVERLQELQYIAEVSNSTSDALASSMSGLSSKIGEAAQKGSEDFARLGITVRDAYGQVKTADQVLDDVRHRFQQLNLSMSEQRSFAESLGIDPSLVTLLNRTDAEMASLSGRARELGILTAEQTKQAQDYNDAMTSLRFSMDGVRRLVAVGLGPELKDLAESFTNLLAKNRDWIVNGVKFAVGVLNDFMAFVGRMWPIMAGGIAILVALKVATIGWGTVLATVFSPVVLITAAIAGLLLVLDDLMVGFQGGDSIIRSTLLEWFDIDIADLFESWSTAIGDLVDVFNSLPSWAQNLLTGNFVGAGIDLASEFSGPNGGGFSAASNGGSVTQTVQMNIRTSDPQKAGEVAADRLNRQMDDAQTQSRRGGM